MVTRLLAVSLVIGVLLCPAIPCQACPPPCHIEHDWTIDVGGSSYGYYQIRGYDPADSSERILIWGEHSYNLSHRPMVYGLLALTGLGCLTVGAVCVWSRHPLRDVHG